MPHKYRIVRDRTLSRLTRRWRFVGIFLILFCLFMAYGFWSLNAASNLKLATTKFNQTTNTQVDTFSKRFETYADMLYAGRGIFMVKNNLTQSDWATFFGAQSVSDRYPGVNAISYVRVLSAQRLAQDGTTTSDFPALGQIYPTPLTDKVGVVSYIAPYEKYSGSIGYNEFSDSTRAAMLTRAGQDGVVRASAPLELVVSSSVIEKQAAILLALPVYQSDVSDLSTPNARLAAVQGYVMASLYIKPMFDDFVATLSPDNNVSVIVKTTDNHIIYQKLTDTGSAYIGKTTTIDVAGQSWQLDLRAPSDFGLDVASKAAPFVALIRGVAVAVVVLGLMIYASGLRLARHHK